WPEGIFQTDNDTTVQPVPSSVIDPGVLASDRSQLSALLAIKQANIMQFCIQDSTPDSGLNKTQLDTILANHASGEGFTLINGNLEADSTIVKNRLILLMNDTEQQAPNANPLTGGAPWRDTQIWEMEPANGDPNAFSIPFDIDLTTTNPAPRGQIAGAGIPYKVSRSSFLITDPAPWVITDPSKKRYADLHPSTINSRQGSYERWYVANIGNSAPDVKAIATTGNVPDMHPFHIHLVNFVVKNRFVLSRQNSFVQNTPKNSFDNQARHDTVRIQSNELLELLVYFPPGYTGKYPYHCHLVEHEDMGMMLHFSVS
ncbi:MAG: multicopper oxidase domain-containing protein, partial [Methylococcaceae bacterium]|nr:multicopper oxidase domain-containing protein [Methylococcaceae bacterium]